MAKVVEYGKIFKDGNGTEVEIKIKTECSTHEEMRNTLSFMAQSSRTFYLEVAKEISNML